jgi:Ala-tRNA(Pro) deacylase
MITTVCQYLDKLNIQYTLLRHPPVVTTEDSKAIVHVAGCMSCKSLYVKDKKSDHFYMVVLSADTRADMRRLASFVGAAKFEFATEERLFADLKVHRGSVSPFAFLLERQDIDLPLLIGSDVWNADAVKFHPADNTATVILSLADFKKYLLSLNKTTIVVD